MTSALGSGPGAGTLLVILLGLAQPAAALQFDFTATVESVTGDGTAFPRLDVGSRFDGCYEFDETVPDSNPGATIGVYLDPVRSVVIRDRIDASPPHCGPGQASCVSCADEQGLISAIGVVNEPTVNQYALSLTPPCSAVLLEPAGASQVQLQVGIQATDTDAVALASDALPVVPPAIPCPELDGTQMLGASLALLAALGAGSRGLRGLVAG